MTLKPQRARIKHALYSLATQNHKTSKTIYISQEVFGFPDMCNVLHSPPSGLNWQSAVSQINSLADVLIYIICVCK